VSARCTSTLHTEPEPDLPAAVYRVYAEPCHHQACKGLSCGGHPLCPACVAEIRAARTEWTATAETVEVTKVVWWRPCDRHRA
jgi:hypothetical protein